MVGAVVRPGLLSEAVLAQVAEVLDTYDPDPANQTNEDTRPVGIPELIAALADTLYAHSLFVLDPAIGDLTSFKECITTAAKSLGEAERQLRALQPMCNNRNTRVKERELVGFIMSVGMGAMPIRWAAGVGIVPGPDEVLMRLAVVACLVHTIKSGQPQVPPECIRTLMTESRVNLQVKDGELLLQVPRVAAVRWPDCLGRLALTGSSRAAL